MADGIFLIFPVKRAAFLLSFPVWVYCFSVFAKTYTLSFFHCLFRFLCMFLFVILQLFSFSCKRLQALNKKELLLTVLNHTERVLCCFCYICLAPHILRYTSTPACMESIHTTSHCGFSPFEALTYLFIRLLFTFPFVCSMAILAFSCFLSDIIFHPVCVLH